MQDPLITLFDLFKSGWTGAGGSGDISEANTRFTTGWYDQGYEQPQLTVTELLENYEPFETGYGVVQVDAVYQIDWWITVQRATAKGPGVAKKNLWDGKEIIRTLLRANLTGLTDLRLVIMNNQGSRLDEPQASPPLLRWSLRIAVIYNI